MVFQRVTCFRSKKKKRVACSNLRQNDMSKSAVFSEWCMLGTCIIMLAVPHLSNVSGSAPDCKDIS